MLERTKPVMIVNKAWKSTRGFPFVGRVREGSCCPKIERKFENGGGWRVPTKMEKEEG